MADTLETGQLLLLWRSLRLGVDMDHVARAFPLVALHWLPGLQIPEPAKPQGVHHPPDNGKRRLEGLSDPAERAALVPEVHSPLQLLRIERPPLGAAHTPSIHQCRYTAITEARQPLVSDAEADPCFRSKGLVRHALIEVPTNRRCRLIGVSRALGWLCMSGEVLGRAVTPRPWRPHTPLSAEQPGETTHLSHTH